MDNNEKMKKIVDMVENFILDNKIRCSESIWQRDNIIENAYDFIENLCDIVGYYKDDEEEE